jgi:hypothetical protein
MPLVQLINHHISCEHHPMHDWSNAATRVVAVAAVHYYARVAAH